MVRQRIQTARGLPNPRSAPKRKRKKGNFFTLPLLCYNENSCRVGISTPGTKRNGRIKREERTSRQHECLQARAGGCSEAAGGEHYHRARGECQATDLASWQRGNAGMPYTSVRLVEGEDASLPETAGVAESDILRTYFGHSTPWLPATTVPMPL